MLEPTTHAGPAGAGEREGAAMFALVEELYPICRSITGDGVRRTLRVLAHHLPVAVHEVPTGTRVLDWTVPREWNVRDAWIADASGQRVVDFRASNLHVVSYSVPVRARMSLHELRPHLHALPDQPDVVPYRTSYYEENWGFCLTQRLLDSLPEGEYDVCIDSTLAPGSLTYGEVVLPGLRDDEILISTHVCHPSLCDDNLTGIAVATFLARGIAAARERRHTIRFLFAPGTIGAITWLALNKDAARRVRHGLTLTCLGDEHPLTFKRTIGGASEIDRAAAHVLAASGLPHRLVDFTPYGYDERQFNSPGFRIPVGSLVRGVHGRFPEYHTSADGLGFVSPARMAESLAAVRAIVGVLEGNQRYCSLCPEGEPQLGRRGLYATLGGRSVPDLQLALLWVLALSDGTSTLLDVAERAGMPFGTVRAAANALVQHGLLREATAS
jgi:aminopeptidase-like protein